MEKLIEDLVSRIKTNIDNDQAKIKSLDSEPYDSNILFLTGKLFAYEYCIKELKRIIKYHKECILKP